MLFSSSTRYFQIEMFQVNINISNGLSHTINPIRNLEEFIILIFDYEKSVFRGGYRIFCLGGVGSKQGRIHHASHEVSRTGWALEEKWK